MKKKNKMKFSVLLISIVCVALLVTPVCNAVVKPTMLETLGKNHSLEIKKQLDSYSLQEETEYWAVLFAVGVYKNNPDQNRPSMLEAVNDLYDVLIDSPQWQPDHIRMTTGEQATGKNLVKDLIWLIRNEDKDDMSFIYITTHGSPLKNANGMPVDLPPRDEDDGADEILVMYEGFDKWYAFIWDDLLNFFLSLLQSQGVCLIVDSCFSGGFNDGPMFEGFIPEEYTAESFTQGFIEDLATQGRVVLMSCRENEVSYGSFFSDFLIGGFEGLADLYGNGDGINSAEEAFAFAKSWLDLFGEQHPTMLDLFPGEYPVTLS